MCLACAGQVTTGASDDLQKASRIAQNMIGVYGMSKTMGPRALLPIPHDISDSEGQPGGQMTPTQQQADREVSHFRTLKSEWKDDFTQIVIVVVMFAEGQGAWILLLWLWKPSCTVLYVPLHSLYCSDVSLTRSLRAHTTRTHRHVVSKLKYILGVFV